jgi:hypothetical protein
VESQIDAVKDERMKCSQERPQTAPDQEGEWAIISTEPGRAPQDLGEVPPLKPYKMRYIIGEERQAKGKPVYPASDQDQQ